LITPNSAFVTFESESGYNYWRKKKFLKLNDQTLVFKVATEPTNIVWENKYQSKNKWKKILYCSFVVTILLTATFSIIYNLEASEEE
jgi:cell division protein FtsL